MELSTACLRLVTFAAERKPSSGGRNPFLLRVEGHVFYKVGQPGSSCAVAKEETQFYIRGRDGIIDNVNRESNLSGACGVLICVLERAWVAARNPKAGMKFSKEFSSIPHSTSLPYSIMSNRMMQGVFGAGFLRSSLLFLWLAGLVPAFAQSVPNRYALILEDPPTLTQVGRREELQRAAAVNIRQQIEARQRAVRAQLASLHVPVTGSVSTVMNALFVIATKDQVSALQSIPGVKGAVQVRRYTRSLNRALSLLNAAGAWNLPGVGGAANAGKGIKIGILDDGIEQTNPMFQGFSQPMPAGFPVCGGWDQAAAQCGSFTNNKVIVARSYVKLLAGFSPAGASPDPAVSRPDDYTPSGRDGHGTAVASVAGGLPATGTVTVNGMAPGVYLGNYKIYGSPEVNDSTSDDEIIAALEDAVKDGMDIVSFSSGGPALTGPLDAGAACGNSSGVPCDLSAQAFETAARAGLVIVAAAGNDGYTAVRYPNFNSISSPGDAPSVITVGATSNSHYFHETVQVTGSGVPSGLQSIAAAFSDASTPAGSVTAPLLDVAKLDNSGLACSTLPPGSLAGAFALIQRGTCSFVQKTADALAAGAAGIVFYMADASALISPVVCNPSGSCSAPPVAMISQSDGLALKSFIQANTGRAVTINPNGAEVLDTAGQNLLAGFSSLGPSTGDSLIKPDLLAVGETAGGVSEPNGNIPGIYMAASTIDPLGSLYSSDGFIAASGTSFATPMVAGAAAIVKQNHPNFTAAQIKSALVNTTSQVVQTDDSSTGSPIPVDTQSLGSGLLDAGAAASATVSVNPATLSFGAIGSGSLPKSKTLTVTNSGSGTVSLALVFASGSLGASLLTPSTLSLSIGPGGSGTVTVTLAGTPPPAKEYSGAILLQGSGVSLRVPYMYIVGDGVIANIVPLLGDQNDGTVNQTIPDGTLALKVTDDYGLPIAGVPVAFLTNQPGSRLASVSNSSVSSIVLSTTTDQYGIAYAVATLGSQVGTYTFSACANSCGSSGLQYTFTDFARLAPTVQPGAVVSNASYAVGVPVAPGSYVSIFGTGLSDTTDYAPNPNLPLTIDFVTVSFDVPTANISLPGRLLYVSPGQVNVQVPWELHGQSSARVKVTIDQSYGNVVSVALSDYAPGLIEFSPGVVAAQDTSFNGIGPGNPAKRGQTIELYANGLGPVTNQPATGQAALSSPLSQTTSMPTVSIGGQTAAVSFSGLSAGWSSLYQINVVVPQSLSPGNYPVSVSIGGRTSNTSGIVVQ
jgi:minor extracellular serine protease Vpr